MVYQKLHLGSENVSCREGSALILGKVPYPFLSTSDILPAEAFRVFNAFWKIGATNLQSEELDGASLQKHNQGL